MDRSYLDCLHRLTDNNINVLKSIITTKYKKLKNVYKSIYNRYADIAVFKYIFTNEDTLEIELGLYEDVDTDDFIQSISICCSENNTSIKKKKNLIYISIELEEVYT